MTIKNNWLPTIKNIQDYSLLENMLKAQRQEFDLLSKKKSNEQLNKMKIKMLNRVLEPLNELLKNEPSFKFLDLPNEDDMPTNSDVVLIISQYEKAMEEFDDKYYLEDTVGGYNKRWNTSENPIEEEEADEYEDEEEE